MPGRRLRALPVACSRPLGAFTAETGVVFSAAAVRRHIEQVKSGEVGAGIDDLVEGMLTRQFWDIGHPLAMNRALFDKMLADNYDVLVNTDSELYHVETDTYDRGLYVIARKRV